MRKGIFSVVVTALLFTYINMQTIYGASQISMTLYYDGQAHKYTADEINLMVDGRDIRNLSMPPVIINDYTMVPVREVFEQLGAFVDWNGANGLVYIAYGFDLVILQIDSNVAYLNENPILMDAAPKIINDKTMIPVRFAAEALGFKVGWDPDKRIVSVDTPTKQEVVNTETPPVTPNATLDNNYTSAHIGTDSITDTLEQVVTDLEDIIPAKDVSTSAIVNKSFPETSIVSVSVADNGRHGVDIAASSEISKVETFLLNDNRLILDFYGAVMNTPAAEVIPQNASAVKKIRIAQNQLVPEKITRVVLELQNAVNYAISISGDRKTVSVDFEKNTITDVSYSSDGTADYIIITGIRTPSVEMSILSNPDRLAADLPYAFIEQQEIPVGSRFLKSIRAAQFDVGIARVVLDLADRVKYTLSYTENSVTIKLQEPTYKNVWYDNASRTILLKKDYYSPISAQSISKTDMYSKGKYAFTLPGNYTGIYGFGEYDIHDLNMRTINIETVGNFTTITANERKVFEAVVTEDNEYVYISFKNPREVYDKVVVIDPGHGGNDPGTSGFGIEEKDLTLDISLRLVGLLSDSYRQTGVKVYATRLDDTYMSRFDRGPFASEIGDLFVSVHINSAAPNQVPNGTETYYYPHDNDNTVGISTEKTASIFHKHLLNSLTSTDRKVKKNSYTVLLETTIPSVLCEIGFLSNPAEAQLLKSPEYRQKAAQALYEAIMETFTVYTPKR